MTGGRKWEARERGDGTWIVRNTQNCQLVAEDLTESEARDIAAINDIKAERDEAVKLLTEWDSGASGMEYSTSQFLTSIKEQGDG